MIFDTRQRLALTVIREIANLGIAQIPGFNGRKCHDSFLLITYLRIKR